MRALRHRYNFRTCCQEILERPAVAATDWKDTSHDLGGITYVYRLEEHKLRFASSSSTGLRRWYIPSRCRYRLMHPVFPTRLSVTETQSPPPSFGPPGTTFELDCGYHLRVFYEGIHESHDCMQKEPSARTWYSKSLSAGPLGLRAWIWPSSGRFGSTAYILGLIEVMTNLSLPDLVRFRA